MNKEMDYYQYLAVRKNLVRDKQDLLNLLDAPTSGNFPFLDSLDKPIKEIIKDMDKQIWVLDKYYNYMGDSPLNSASRRNLDKFRKGEGLETAS